MIFLNSASSAGALVFYLSYVCTLTDTEAEQGKARVRNKFKIFEKIQYLMNTLYPNFAFVGVDRLLSLSTSNLNFDIIPILL